MKKTGIRIKYFLPSRRNSKEDEKARHSFFFKYIFDKGLIRKIKNSYTQ